MLQPHEIASYHNAKVSVKGKGETLPYTAFVAKYVGGGKPISTTTKRHLDDLSTALGVVWESAIIVEVPQHRGKGAHSTVILGKVNGVVVEYWRKETAAPGAGQTWVHLNGKSRIKMTVLIDLCTLMLGGKVDNLQEIFLEADLPKQAAEMLKKNPDSYGRNPTTGSFELMPNTVKKFLTSLKARNCALSADWVRIFQAAMKLGNHRNVALTSTCAVLRTIAQMK